MPKRTRLTLALEDATYQALRLVAFVQDRTHQSIMEEALKDWLCSYGYLRKPEEGQAYEHTSR